VLTIGSRAFSTVSIWGMTCLSDDEVHNTTTSGFSRRSAPAASLVTRTFSLRPSLMTSPRSRPSFAGSMSMPPAILKPLRVATCSATAAPIGPRP
jgi:hypothetical protein